MSLLLFIDDLVLGCRNAKITARQLENTKRDDELCSHDFHNMDLSNDQSAFRSINQSINQYRVFVDEANLPSLFSCINSRTVV